MFLASLLLSFFCLVGLVSRVASSVPSQVRGVATKVSNPLGREICHNPPSKTPGFGLARFMQANFFRSNAVFVTATVLAAAVASGAYDAAFETAWAINNKGKLYDDIIKRYPGLPPNTEPEGGAAEEEEEAEEEAADEE